MLFRYQENWGHVKSIVYLGCLVCNVSEIMPGVAIIVGPWLKVILSVGN